MVMQSPGRVYLWCDIPFSPCAIGKFTAPVLQSSNKMTEF